MQTQSMKQNYLDLHLFPRQVSWAAWQTLASVGTGILLLAALAQVAIPLPFTPVPITGQTFGVILVALLYGRDKGFVTVSGYLAIGSLGVPVFAVAGGVTVGYLVGMAVAALVIGELADRGWGSSFVRSFLAGFVGTAIIFAFGLTVLAYFMPVEKIWMAGLIPFIPGAVLKMVMASAIASGLHLQKRRSEP